ncbi:MAG: pilus assembly protein CpaC [Bryobacterales bacterium]|nr:pilus assembly protein CpaC [Bryobacterales bacterium]
MARLPQYCGLLLAAGILVPGSPALEPPNNFSLGVTVGKSLIIDTDADIVRVSVAGATLAETVAINAREILVNGLTPGETSLVIWEVGGARLVYSLTVRPSSARLDAVRLQLASESGFEGVTLDFANDTAFLRGRVGDIVSAERAVTIAATLGNVVNLLYVTAPPVQGQVLLKVRFANVERSVSSQLGVNIITTGHLNTPGSTSTGQFTLGDALNLLLFRKDFNLSATLTALQNQNLVEILAEPNLLAIDGQSASFVAGGEFPYPTVQGGAAAGAVSIAFREFGVSIKFLPTITPRGTIRLHVAPEVSSLDFANGLTFQGFHVPALVTRRVETEVELESGQSFAIAGLLDNRVTETLSKVPGIGDIPILGKLFQNRTRSTSNSELLIIITPELVRPIPAGAPVPDLLRPKEFLKDAPQQVPRTPGIERTGPVPASDPNAVVPFERLQKAKEVQRATAGPASRTQPAAAPVPPVSGQPEGPAK